MYCMLGYKEQLLHEASYSCSMSYVNSDGFISRTKELMSRLSYSLILTSCLRRLFSLVFFIFLSVKLVKLVGQKLYVVRHTRGPTQLNYTRCAAQYVTLLIHFKFQIHVTASWTQSFILRSQLKLIINTRQIAICVPLFYI